ncbi:metalloreductase STEAP3-like isoform X2 [Nelusetta ayraudi]|uniref:metalloreductase STEAP3-like isoform X2 n=1 Tax=Nelusetta ayraudi TaxID=303726 RepID=UPI003F6E7AD0
MPDDMSRPLIRDDGGAAGGEGRGGGSRRLEASLSDPTDPLVGILGTGDFSRSLAQRLLAAGYQVVVGSRTPKRFVALFPEEVEVMSQMEVVSQADLVFVAVYPEHHSTLAPLKAALARKTLVDVSNGLRLSRDGPSNAELLADMFPESCVVKAFNTVSAWTLQTGPRDGSRQIFLCGDSLQAKSSVAQLCRRLGFVPVDVGLLSSALDVENLPLHLFPCWRAPLLCTLLLFAFFYAYNFARDVLQPYVKHGKNVFHKMPIETVNVTLPSAALVLLSLVYLPGLCAAALQLCRGTKYRRFPGWLDRWLQRRKQLGLCSFLCAALHAVYSLVLPMRKSAHNKLLAMALKQASGAAESYSEGEVWRMELYLSVGIMALGLLSLLAVTSLPSVANAVNWREFSFIQEGRRIWLLQLQEQIKRKKKAF